MILGSSMNNNADWVNQELFKCSTPHMTRAYDPTSSGEIKSCMSGGWFSICRYIFGSWKTYPNSRTSSHSRDITRYDRIKEAWNSYLSREFSSCKVLYFWWLWEWFCHRYYWIIKFHKEWAHTKCWTQYPRKWSSNRYILAKDGYSGIRTSFMVWCFLE